MNPYVLLAAAPEKVGLLDVLLSWLRGYGAVPATNIRVFTDPGRAVTFARIEFGCLAALEELEADLRGVAEAWPLEAWHLQSLQRPRILVLASLTDHCVHELLARHRRGRLAGDVVAVAANHAALRGLVEAHEVPFVHLNWPGPGAAPDAVAAAHTELAELVKSTRAECVVMARFMRILPPSILELAPVINAHHDDVERYPGADPHARVRDRGVKTVAATAHYATAELDAGPIITQVSHGIEDLGPVPSTAELRTAGRLAEAAALATAVNRRGRGELLVFRGLAVHIPR